MSGLHALLVVILVLVLLSAFGGYAGHIPTHFAYGGSGLGTVLLIVLIVLLVR